MQNLSFRSGTGTKERKKERWKEMREAFETTDLMQGRAVTNSSTGAAAMERRT
jgi:hypothetical protein